MKRGSENNNSIWTKRAYQGVDGKGKLGLFQTFKQKFSRDKNIHRCLIKDTSLSRNKKT